MKQIILFVTLFLTAPFAFGQNEGPKEITPQILAKSRFKQTSKIRKGYMTKSLFIILLTMFCSNIYGQRASYKDRRATSNIGAYDFLVISMEYFSERYERKEVNIIYHENNILKIHSILKSNYEKDKKVDTVFSLNAKQIRIVDEFENYFNKNEFPKEIILAGTISIFKITLNGETKTLENKNNYSLISHLLNE